MQPDVLDDVVSLSKLKKGDPEILSRIRRACEQGEVISVYERRYIGELASKFLRPQTTIPAAPQPAPVEPPKTVPEKVKRGRRLMRRPGKKIMILAIIIVAAVAASAIFSLAGFEAAPAENIELGVRTDSESYESDDFVSISGQAEPGGQVILEITDGITTLWSRAVLPREDGAYSELFIADKSIWGPGSYILVAAQGNMTWYAAFEIVQITGTS